MKKHKSSRVNIYTLFAAIPTFIYLIPLTFIQNILFKPNSIWEQIASYSLNLLFITFVGGFSVCGYLTKRYTGGLDYTYIQKGFPIRSRFDIPHSRLQSVIMQKGPLSALFNAVKIQLNTPATKAKKGDAMFYLSSQKANRLIREIYDDIGQMLFYYKAQNIRIFFMAAIWSNPISGILLIAPFINNLGKISGEQLGTQLLESFDLSVYLMYIGLPPTTALITYFLLVCYAISVVADFIRNASYNCTSYQNGLLIRRGILKRTFFFTNCRKLNAISINQSLIMLPTKLYSAYIHTVGAGKTKGDKSLLIAAEKKDNVKQLLKGLLCNPDLNFTFMIHPVKKSLKSYLFVPFILLCSDIALSLYLQYENIIPNLTFNITVFTVPWILSWCVFRVIAHKKSAVSYNNSFIYIRGYKRLTFTSTLIPLNKAQLCLLRVNLFQKLGGTCNIRVYIFGEKRTYVEIKHISIKDGIKITNEINNKVTTKRDFSAF